MVLYKQSWTCLQFYSYIYSYNYIGGVNMDINNSYFENKETTTYLNLFKLSEFIDSKINLIKEYSVLNKSFCGKALFLENWIKESKIPVFKEITDYNNFRTIKPDKYDSINSRINKYFSYFDIIESEYDEEEIYEQIFDTLVQIPSEIYNFVEIVPIDKYAKFVDNKYITKYVTKSNKNVSSKLEIAA